MLPIRTYDLNGPNPTEAINQAEQRQRETDEALSAEREWAGRHRREETVRLDGEARAARADLTERALAKAAERGLSFAAPDVPGEGWASTELRLASARISSTARDRFTVLVEAEEGVAGAKRYLGGSVESPIVVGPTRELASLEVMRSRHDVAEARFVAAYEALETRRAQLKDPAFVERIEALNAIAQAAFFTACAHSELPEMVAIADAIRVILEAAKAIEARHEEALGKVRDGTLLTRQLGLATPDWRHTVTPLLGQRLAQRAAAGAESDWNRSNPGARIDLSSWLPDWRDPHA